MPGQWNAMPRHWTAMDGNTMPRHVMAAMPCHAVPCSAMQCHAVPCLAMPRHAMSWHIDGNGRQCRPATDEKGFHATPPDNGDDRSHEGDVDMLSSLDPGLAAASGASCSLGSDSGDLGCDLCGALGHHISELETFVNAWPSPFLPSSSRKKKRPVSSSPSTAFRPSSMIPRRRTTEGVIGARRLEYLTCRSIG